MNNVVSLVGFDNPIGVVHPKFGQLLCPHAVELAKDVFADFLVGGQIVHMDPSPYYSDFGLSKRE
jgi:hypothetical protein